MFWPLAAPSLSCQAPGWESLIHCVGSLLDLSVLNNLVSSRSMENDNTSELALLQQLVKLIKADGRSHDFELNFLESIAKQMGLKGDIYAQFDAAAEGELPVEEFQRIIQFQRLVLMSHVDLEVDSSELKMLRQFGLILGLREEAVLAVFDEMKQHPHGMIPVTKLVEIFQVYHN